MQRPSYASIISSIFPPIITLHLFALLFFLDIHLPILMMCPSKFLFLIEVIAFRAHNIVPFTFTSTSATISSSFKLTGLTSERYYSTLKIYISSYVVKSNVYNKKYINISLQKPIIRLFKRIIFYYTS